jgi:hypothetical protein
MLKVDVFAAVRRESHADFSLRARIGEPSSSS